MYAYGKYYLQQIINEMDTKFPEWKFSTPFLQYYNKYSSMPFDLNYFKMPVPAEVILAINDFYDEYFCTRYKCTTLKPPPLPSEYLLRQVPEFADHPQQRTKNEQQLYIKNVIKIDHFLDKPFGPLRNDYNYTLIIDENRWKGVDNYVYSNMFPPMDMRKNIIANIAPHKVKHYFLEALGDVELKSLSYAINHGIDAKIASDSLYKKTLLESGDMYISYMSENHIMGVGFSDKYYNLFGSWLIYHRDKLLKEKPQEQNIDDFYYDIYICEHGLTYALQYENLENYIPISKSKGFIGIIAELIKKYGKHKIITIDKVTALSLQKYRHSIIIKDPIQLIRYIRKTKIRDVKNKNEALIISEALSLFMNYVLEIQTTNISDHERRRIIDQQLGLVSLDEISKLRERVMKLYENRGLPKSVEYQIINFKNSYYLPSLEEINYYENDPVIIPSTIQTVEHFNIDLKGIAPFEAKLLERRKGRTTLIKRQPPRQPPPQKQPPQKQQPPPQKQPTKTFIWIYPYTDDNVLVYNNKRLEHTHFDYLSPMNDSTIIEIEIDMQKIKFPSINHYLIYSMGRLLPNTSISQCYNIIYDQQSRKFYSNREAQERLENLKSEVYTIYKQNLLFKALHSKFSIQYFKDILFSTNSKDLSIKGNDEYYTKNILYDIRSHLIPDTRLMLDSELSSFIEYDEFLKILFQEKLAAVCKTIKIVQIWYKQNNKDIVADSKFVKRVLKCFFPDCMDVKFNTQISDMSFFQPMILPFFKIANEPTSYAIDQKTIFILFNFLITIFYKLFITINDMVSITENTKYFSLQLFKYAIICQQWNLFNAVKMKTQNILFPVAKTKSNSQDIIAAILSCIASLYNFNPQIMINKSHVYAAVSCITQEYQQIQDSDIRIQILEEDILKDIPDMIDQDIGGPDAKDIDQDTTELDAEGIELDVDSEEIEQDYGEELQELDEEAYYEGIVAPISEHLRQIGNFDNTVVELIQTEAEKIKHKHKDLAIHFYALE
jgi:hypothetical protein